MSDDLREALLQAASVGVLIGLILLTRLLDLHAVPLYLVAIPFVCVAHWMVVSRKAVSRPGVAWFFLHLVAWAGGACVLWGVFFQQHYPHVEDGLTIVMYCFMQALGPAALFNYVFAKAVWPTAWARHSELAPLAVAQRDANEHGEAWRLAQMREEGWERYRKSAVTLYQEVERDSKRTFSYEAALLFILFGDDPERTRELLRWSVDERRRRLHLVKEWKGATRHEEPVSPPHGARAG